MEISHSPSTGHQMLPQGPTQTSTSFHPQPHAYMHAPADTNWTSNTQLSNGHSSLPPISLDYERSILSPVFVSNTIQSLGLDDNQAKLLHGLYQVGCLAEGLSRPDLGSRIFATGIVLASENRILAALKKSPRHQDKGDGLDHEALLKEIVIRLEDTFVLTTDQLINVRRVCQNIVFSTNRTSYKHMHVDVEAELRKYADKYTLSNVYGRGPAREAKLMSFVKRIGSNVRNQFRQDLRNSVLPGPRSCSLDKFTLACSLKYRTSSISSRLDPGYNRHNALLRRFAYEHKHLLENKEVFVDADSDPTGVQTNTAPDVDTAKTGTKRKAGGRVASGDDFWAQVDSWFAEQSVTRGEDFASPEWTSYIDESIRLDNARFEDPTEPARAVEEPTPLHAQVAQQSVVGNGNAFGSGPGQDDMMALILASAAS